MSDRTQQPEDDRKMTDNKDEDLLGLDGYPVDEDYIDVQSERAEVSLAGQQTTDGAQQTADSGSKAADSGPKAAADGAQQTAGALQTSDGHRILGPRQRYRNGKQQPSEPRQPPGNYEDFWLSRGPGDGSARQLDAEMDQMAIVEHDGRASTRTFFYPEQAPEHQQSQYRRLIRYQEDAWSGMKNQQRAADRKRTAENFCGFLGMTPYQKERVKKVTESFSMQTMAYFSSPKVILGIISLVANEDNRWIRDEEVFRELMHNTDTTLEELKTIRRMVRERSDLIG